MIEYKSVIVYPGTLPIWVLMYSCWLYPT